MLYSSRFSAILDACVLYPAPIRDILLCMAEQGLYRPKWSALIQKEWKRNLLKSRPDLKKIRLDRTSELMNNAFPDAEVQHFENLIQNLELLILMIIMFLPQQSEVAAIALLPST